MCTCSRLVLRPMRVWVIVMFATVLGAALNAEARQVDHRGREFWVTFMPNLGSRLTEASRLRLYLLSDEGTRATITYTATGVSREVTVSSNNITAVVDLNKLFGDSTELDDFTIGNGITAKSFHVQAESDITVIGLNARFKSADAFLALPVGALDLHYLVLAYPNGFDVNSGQHDTPSEFAVVGIEDGTRLNVTRPRGVIINGRPEETFTIILNRGEVFLGQAQLRESGDVSGTEISADRPVAVFAGTKRASNPVNHGNFRDHMVEQLIPDRYWKKTVVAAPHLFYTGALDSMLYSVISRETTTVSIVKGTKSYDAVIPGRQAFYFVSTDVVRIVSTAPVLVARYDPSQPNMNPPGPAPLGDPSMSLVPAPEQWDTVYRFTCISDPDFTVHYIDVVAPRDAAISIDGVPVTAPRKSIDDQLDYIQITLTPGAHRVASSVPISVMVYGAGESTSYAYPGGFLLDRSAAVSVPLGGDVAAISLLATPNPVSGNYLDVELELHEGAAAHVDIINAAGAVVLAGADVSAQTVGAGRFRIDISALPAGIYFCRAADSRGGHAMVKFVRR